MPTSIDDPSHPLRPRESDDASRVDSDRRAAAARACEDLILQLDGAVTRAIAAHTAEWAAHETILLSLVGRFAACARAAGYGADVLLRQLHTALASYADVRPEHAAELLRVGIVGYFDVVT